MKEKTTEWGGGGQGKGITSRIRQGQTGFIVQFDPGPNAGGGSFVLLTAVDFGRTNHGEREEGEQGGGAGSSPGRVE